MNIMKNKIIATAIILILSSFAAISTYAEKADKQTVVFTVSPKMHCVNCENKIKTNLRFEKGVNDITTNVKNNTVTIVYDKNKTDEIKLVDAFAKIGYKAETNPAEAKQ